MQNRKILINAMMSVLQVIVIAFALFVLYRFLLNALGVERLGIWSIVMAMTSIGQISNLGFSASVLKFVAKYQAHDDQESVAALIQTSAIFIGILAGGVILIVYPLAAWLLGHILRDSNLGEALSILPYALGSLWITILSGIFQSSLDGFQRIAIRSMLLMAGAVLQLTLCLALVPTFGLLGVAYAQVSQALVLLIAGWLILKRHLPLLPIVPWHWDQNLFREMVGYGVNFQIITVSQLLYDPITKGLLTKFGDLSMTGYYEMANRMILQLRSLLVAANQVLVPVIADFQEKNQKAIEEIYKRSYRLLFYIALPMFSAILAFIPIISEAWIGHFESQFVVFANLLTIGWFMNSVASPAYFSNLGIGDLRWNTIGHIIIAVLNLGLGWLLGSIFGGSAVVVAWVISLIAGSLIIPISFHLKYNIPVTELFPEENGPVGFASLVGLTLSLLIYHQMNDHLSLLALSGIIVISFSVIVIIPVWLHPMRKRSIGWVVDEFMKIQKVSVEK